jgi:hypothetical protein
MVLFPAQKNAVYMKQYRQIGMLYRAYYPQKGEIFYVVYYS